MTIDEIRCSILEMIEEIYKSKYTGKLFIKRMEPVGLTVVFGMNNNDKPLVISAELNDVDFMRFLRKELRERGLNTVKYFLGVKSYPDNCNGPIDTSCQCK